MKQVLCKHVFFILPFDLCVYKVLVLPFDFPNHSTFFMKVEALFCSNWRITQEKISRFSDLPKQNSKNLQLHVRK